MNRKVLIAGFASILALGGLSLAGSAPDPIAGLWSAHMTMLSESGPNSEIEQFDTTITYNANHQVNWNSQYSGQWIQRNGKYSFDLSRSYEVYHETMFPGAKVHASLKFTKVVRSGDAQFGNLRLKDVTKTHGQKFKLLQFGAFGAERQ